MSWVVVSRIRSAAISLASDDRTGPEPVETGERSDPARVYLLVAALAFIALCVWIGEVLR